jgi:hypothetical protein
MSKARNQQVQRRAKRPIDKKLINVVVNNLVAANQTVDLYTASFPGTITGLRWDLAFQRTVTNTTIANYGWAIVLQPQGTTVSTMSLTGSLYDPEQMVMAFGRGNSFDPSQDPSMFVGDTKSMRKLKAGDKLVFVAFGTATHEHEIGGTVQFFYKT